MELEYDRNLENLRVVLQPKERDVKALVGGALGAILFQSCACEVVMTMPEIEQ